jgi:hypothetical protein
MALNRRQLRIYQHRVNLYRPQELSYDEFNSQESVQFFTDPAYSNIPCGYFESDELDTISVVGRLNHDIMLTIDKFHFETGQEIEDGWLIELMTPGNPDANKFWITQGNAKDRQTIGKRRANYRRVYAKRTAPPPGIRNLTVA